MSSLFLTDKSKYNDKVVPALLVIALFQLMSFPENRSAKPPYSYAALICLALATSHQRMTLNMIYNWVRSKFAFFRYGDQSWTVSQYDMDL